MNSRIRLKFGVLLVKAHALASSRKPVGAPALSAAATLFSAFLKGIVSVTLRPCFLERKGEDR
jgi:hypothetical protein